MKYFILLTDGLADEPIKKLNNITPLEAAKTPLTNLIASAGHYAMLSPTPSGCTGGSEVGNLTILGYDPRVHLTGRSPIEAAAIGIDMVEDDVALRCNFITLSDEKEYSQKRKRTGNSAGALCNYVTISKNNAVWGKTRSVITAS